MGEDSVNQLNNLALSRLHEPGVTTDGLTNLGYILGTLGCPVDRVENEQPDVRAGYLQGRVDHSRAYAGELALLWLSSGDLAVKKAAIRVLADVQPAGAMNALQHVRQEFNALKEKTPDDWDVLRRVAIAEACIYGDQKNGGQESQ